MVVYLQWFPELDLDGKIIGIKYWDIGWVDMLLGAASDFMPLESVEPIDFESP